MDLFTKIYKLFIDDIEEKENRKASLEEVDFCLKRAIETVTEGELGKDKFINDYKLELSQLYNEEIERISENFEPNITIRTDNPTWLKEYYEQYFEECGGKTFLERYKEYLKLKKFDYTARKKIINSMKEVMDLAGNPQREDSFSRKGMVIGDVQSGKTANYTGLVNLGIDTKYNLIIVLTGITNQLRSQTQARIEEGAPSPNVHIELSRKQKYQRLENEYSDLNFPTYLTSYSNDVKKDLGTISSSITNNAVTHIIVTKKNTYSLNSIYDWLVKNNGKHIDSSLLLIDDEADNASVNTNKEEDDPTAINSKIRQILNLFKRNSYIGFTATPFANIFIDPNSNKDMYGQDLFPKDYIYVLGESSAYLGVQALFGEENEGQYQHVKVPIHHDDMEECLPLKHNKDYDIEYLSDDLIDAINCFFISNSLLDSKNELMKHRSMMINVSRFNEVQNKVAELVDEYVYKVKNSLRTGIHDIYYESLESTFNRLYLNNLDENSSIKTFEDIVPLLYNSNKNVDLLVVNQNGDSLDYNSDSSRVIVIGGLALARGLTLEGLIVSYYWRSTDTYDGLLQAGRWFGYRKKYINECRIFLTNEKINDFEFIADATKELKDDLKYNFEKENKPEQFGIRVRSGQNGLMITARNKMRSSIEGLVAMNFDLDVVEPRTFEYRNEEVLISNEQLIADLVSRNQEKITNGFDPTHRKEVFGLKDVDKADICTLIENYNVNNYGCFNTRIIKEWLEKEDNPKLDYWDIIFMEGSADKQYEYGSIQGNCNTRTMIRSDEQSEIVKANRCRIGSSSDGKYGMSEEDYNLCISENKDRYNSIPQKAYLRKEYHHKPTLLIYHIIPLDSEDKKVLSEKPLIAISLEIPELYDGISSKETYTFNATEMNNRG